MAVSKSDYEVIRTLHSCGYSMRAIAAAIRFPVSSLHREFETIIKDLPEGDTDLTVSNYKEARLLTMSMSTDDFNEELSALKAIDTKPTETKKVEVSLSTLIDEKLDGQSN